MSSTDINHLLCIRTVEGGLYKGFNPTVALSSKLVILVLVICLVGYPATAAAFTETLRDITLRLFASWYVYLVGIFVVACILLALHPASGRIKMGRHGDIPDHSTQSWLAMMFCAGIGVGILAFSVSEPISHYASNPDTLAGTVPAASSATISSAMRFTFLHWGFSAWACYAVIGVSLGLACHSHGQPLTMRSALVPLFGRVLEGPLGHLVDIISILAIVAGITTTIVLGLEQICSGLSLLTGSAFFADHAGDPPLIALLTALVVTISVAISSILSGVDRGVKWVSNAGVIAAFGMLVVFAMAMSDGRLPGILAEGTWTYLRTLPAQMFNVYGVEASPIANAQADWQSDWTVFYWAWWIAFAPFVGLFLARISRGRTLREFILGAMIGPTAMCFIWFSVIGGSALLLEADGTAGGRIIAAPHAFRIYETIAMMFDGPFATLMNAAVAVLFLLLIVASSTAAIIAIKSIGSAGGTLSQTPVHSLIWAMAIAAISGAVMSVGGVQSVRDVMIVAAVPFSGIMALMLASVLRLLWLRSRTGAVTLFRT
jgi:choline-glycine betaine transporter